MDAPHQADGVILETLCVQDVAVRQKLPIEVLVDFGVMLTTSLWERACSRAFKKIKRSRGKLAPTG
ncbi:hypothetical protein ACTXN4_16800, partial [Pseudomonas helleri]|uniref:hypothetical protein n=1 Tax=Pseudomonas helleri TaxID=1608996 RepID=UPI003FD5FCA4